MANGTTAAVTEAARLDEIGFPEFTTKLITDTFDALVSANLRQTEAYINVVSEVGKSLAQFINDTQEDIGGEEILQFLALAAPADEASESPTKIAVGATLSTNGEGTDADRLNDALALSDDAGVSNNNKVDLPGQANGDGDVVTLTQEHVDAITEAAAKRIAATRYGLLKEMVKQGILRLVVENGVIESRLTFTTYGSTAYQRNSSTFDRSTSRNKSRGGTGALVSLFGNYSSKTYRTNMSVRTTKETQRDTSGSQVQIFGLVRINFRTDYQPLNV